MASPAHARAARDPFARRVVALAVVFAALVAVLSAEPLGFVGGLVLLPVFVAGLGLVVGGIARWPRVTFAAACGCAAGLSGLLLGFPLAAAVEERARTIGDRVAASLADHRRELGSYPRTLDELVPGRLRAVPTAPTLLQQRPFGYAVLGADEYVLTFDAALFYYWQRGSTGSWSKRD